MSRLTKIFDLACPASLVHCQHDLVQTTETSVHGAINTLGLTILVKACMFQASTSEVYGDPLIHPQPQSHWGTSIPLARIPVKTKVSVAPRPCFFEYHRQQNLNIKVMRISNTYGPGMHANDGRVSKFIAQALKGDDITACNPNEFTMVKSTGIVLKPVSGQPKLAFPPLPIDDPKQRQSDITLAQNILVREPKVQLESDIKETGAYFKGLLNV